MEGDREVQSSTYCGERAIAGLVMLLRGVCPYVALVLSCYVAICV